MTLTVLDPAAALRTLQASLGTDPATDEGLAASLRAEVHARGNATRTVTLERVRRRLTAALDVDPERLGRQCDALVREGDLILAPGGVLWATPLRAVPLASGAARLFSSLPVSALNEVLGRPVLLRGAVRGWIGSRQWRRGWNR